MVQRKVKIMLIDLLGNVSGLLDTVFGGVGGLLSGLFTSPPTA